MAVYSCPDCGGAVSDRALRCVHCGAPAHLGAGSPGPHAGCFSWGCGVMGFVCVIGFAVVWVRYFW